MRHIFRPTKIGWDKQGPSLFNPISRLSKSALVPLYKDRRVELPVNPALEINAPTCCVVFSIWAFGKVVFRWSRRLLGMAKQNIYDILRHLLRSCATVAELHQRQLGCVDPIIADNGHLFRDLDSGFPQGPHRADCQGILDREQCCHSRHSSHRPGAHSRPDIPRARVFFVILRIPLMFSDIGTTIIPIAMVSIRIRMQRFSMPGSLFLS